MLIPLRIKKGKIPESKMAFNEHEFTHSELKSMYQVGTLRDRTWLSVALNLGWGASDFLALARKDLEPYLVESLEYPIGFWAERKKIKTPCRAHLTFEAVQNLRRYFEMTKDEKLCPLTHAGMGYWLKSLAKKANIVPRGRIHFHMFRKFLMSALANSNINTWHIKLMVGKAIPNAILTYLKNQTKALREEYKRAEPNFILGEISNGVHNIFEKQGKAIENLDEILEKVGIAIAKRITKNTKEQLRKDGVIALETKEELDPMKDWLEIIENYIVFDEDTMNPPTPNRHSKKRRKEKEEGETKS